jgi:hypothetical protein
MIMTGPCVANQIEAVKRRYDTDFRKFPKPFDKKVTLPGKPPVVAGEGDRMRASLR